MVKIIPVPRVNVLHCNLCSRPAKYITLFENDSNVAAIIGQNIRLCEIHAEELFAEVDNVRLAEKRIEEDEEC